VKAELGGGADIMACNRIGGRTPLHFASSYGNPASILALLTAGAAVLVGVGKGYTSLHFAAAFGTSVKFQTLPSAGGDVNARTDERYRSLYLAASSGAF
jgi:ankyrin repeat protein